MPRRSASSRSRARAARRSGARAAAPSSSELASRPSRMRPMFGDSHAVEAFAAAATTRVSSGANTPLPGSMTNTASSSRVAPCTEQDDLGTAVAARCPSSAETAQPSRPAGTGRARVLRAPNSNVAFAARARSRDGPPRMHGHPAVAASSSPGAPTTMSAKPSPSSSGRRRRSMPNPSPGVLGAGHVARALIDDRRRPRPGRAPAAPDPHLAARRDQAGHLRLDDRVALDDVVAAVAVDVGDGEAGRARAVGPSSR